MSSYPPLIESDIFMAITALVAHRLYRHSPGSRVELQLRPTLFDTTGTLEELAYELKTQFIRKGGKSYGRFSDEIGEYPLPSLLKDVRAERLSLLSFSHKFMQLWAEKLEHADTLMDGYVFFVEEKLEASDTLSLYWVEHASGVYLDGDLAVDTSLALDINGFNLAAKILLNDWEAGDSSTYVTLVRARGDKAFADAFTETVAFTDKQNIKFETAEFLQVVDDFSQTLDESTARLTRTKVVDYCLEQNKAGKTVSIDELSKNLAEDVKSYQPEQFVRFVETQKPDIKPEFIPHAGQVRSYVRISGRNDNLSMSFASECLGREIEYDADQDVLTIRNLPAALKNRLIKHMKQQS